MKKQILGAILALSVASHATTAAGQDTGVAPDKPTAQKKGKLVCTVGEHGKPCGGNEFTLTLHPDGNRSLEALQHRPSIGYHNNVLIHVDKDFRPLHATMQFYNSGGFQGAASYLLDGDKLRTTMRTPDSIVAEAIDAPQKFSFGLHPVVTDAWHIWTYDEAEGGVQPITKCAAGAENAEAILCRMIPSTIELLGSETLTVGAGTFETRHYRLGTAVEMWIAGEDHLLVKYYWEKANLLYELKELTITSVD